MEDSKYTVYPTGMEYGALEALPEGSFFVIRSQDVFGAAALYGYAHLVQTSLDLDTDRQVFSPEERKSLETFCENVLTMAEEWRKSGVAKVPD